MKKFGFTLSELIIALGLVGVIAAITVPLISSIIPDKNKVILLKSYKTLTEINQELLSDPGLYMSDGTCIGLRCQQQPLKPPYNTATYSGDSKYIRLLAAHFKEPVTTGISADSSFGTITTKDGVVWSIYMTVDNSIVKSFSLIIDTVSGGTNCSYNATSCKNPDRFLLDVDTNGKVTGVDPLTKAYLANPYKLNDRKKDLAKAKAGG